MGEIALLTGAKLKDSSMESVMISDVASISTAKKGEISFVENRRYASQITSSEASACFLTEDLLSRIPEHMILCSQALREEILQNYRSYFTKRRVKRQKLAVKVSFRKLVLLGRVAELTLV